MYVNRSMIIVATVAFIICVLGGASACSSYCLPVENSLLIKGELVDSESGERLAGVPLEIQLEGKDGPIGEPTATETEAVGFYNFSVWVVTESLGEECIRVTGNPLLDFALASGGVLPLEEDHGDFDFAPQPTPIRAILTVDLDGSSTTITVEIDEDMLCPDGIGAYCLGSVPVGQDQ